MKANEVLKRAIDHLSDRGETYDSPNGERTIPNVVDAFETLTGIRMTYEQGWLFMVLLKLVRSQQGTFKQDTYEDLVAYCGLMGEQASE